MKFEQLIKQLLGEDLNAILAEGRHSDITRMSLTNTLKLNPKFSDGEEFKKAYGPQITQYFKNVNAGIFAKYGPMGNGKQDFDMTEVLSNIYAKMLEDSESINYIVNTRDLTKTSGQTTQEKNFIVKESPIGSATFKTADEMGVPYQKNVNKQRGMVGTIKNVLFELNSEGEDFIFKNFDGKEQKTDATTPSSNVSSENFKITKSIRDPEVKREIEGKFDPDVYSALRTGTFSFVAVNAKATSNELLAEIRDAFNDEGVKVKPLLVLNFLESIGVLAPTDSVEDDVAKEDEEEDEKVDPTKIHEIDIDFFAKGEKPDYKSLGVDTSDIHRDMDFDSSNW